MHTLQLILRVIRLRDVDCIYMLEIVMDGLMEHMHWKEERAWPYKLLDATYVAENKLWYTPECTGNGSNGQAGPSPRAFHIAVVIDCNMFIFGGRSGGKRYAVRQICWSIERQDC